VLEFIEGTSLEVPSGLPIPNLEDLGDPQVEVPSGAPPSDLVAQVLIEGSGREVPAKGTVVARYVGWLWEDSSVFDSNWGNPTPVSFQVAEVIQGWSKGLTGQKVGSRVMLIVPPALAYGGAGSGPVPPGATLIFVVDILAAF